MTEEIVACPYCNCKIGANRLKQHTSRKCPKSPTAIKHKLLHAPKSARIVRETKRVLVRSRLERLFRDLHGGSGKADDEELAKVFKAFYHMYVWQGEGRNFAASRKVAIGSDGEYAVSIHTVSGGLPSLGKRAK